MISQSTLKSSAIVASGTELGAVKPSVALLTRSKKGLPSTLAT